MKKRLMSENDTRRMLKLAGMLKENYDGEHLEEKYEDDPVYGDNPVIDGEYSMDADSELGMGDDVELTSDDIGLQLPRLDNDSLSNYGDMETNGEDVEDEDDPGFVSTAWSRGQKRAEREPKWMKIDRMGSDSLEKSKMYLKGGNFDPYSAEELIDDLEREAESAMDGDVNKAKEIDSVLRKLKSLQLNESRKSKFSKFESFLNEGFESNVELNPDLIGQIEWGEEQDKEEGTVWNVIDSMEYDGRPATGEEMQALEFDSKYKDLFQKLQSRDLDGFDREAKEPYGGMLYEKDSNEKK